MAVITYAGIAQKLKNALDNVEVYEMMFQAGEQLDPADVSMTLGEVTLAADNLTDMLYSVIVAAKAMGA